MTQGERQLSETEKTCARGVTITSWGFFGLFAGFGGAQSLQSSVNGTLGFINLACLYTFFVIVGLICPPMIDAAAGRVGWRAIFFSAGFTYIIMIGSNLDSMPSKNWVQPLANAIVGAGAAFLWTTQNFYFGQCANLAGAAAAPLGTSVTDSVAGMTTKFNSSFFAVFQFSNTASNLVAFGVLLAFKGQAIVTTVLFAVLSTFALLGCLMFCILPSIPHTAVDAGPMSPQTVRRQDKSPTVSSAFMQMADVRLGLMVPWIITNGMTFAFVNGDYTADIVTPLIGEEYVGLFMTGFFAVDTCFTMGWGQLIAKKALGRRSVFIVTGMCWIAFLVTKMLWTREPNFEKSNDVVGKWIPIPGRKTGTTDIALAVTLAVLAGAGDGFWTPGPPAILQSFFAESNLLATMAAYKALQSLGFAIQFALGATLHAYPILRASIILGMIALSYITMLTLVCKHPLDPRARDQLSESLNNSSASAPPVGTSLPINPAPEPAAR